MKTILTPSISKTNSLRAQGISPNVEITRKGATSAAAYIGQEPVVMDPNITQFGSVSQLSVGTGDFFELEFAPGTIGKTYVIGDPNGVVQASLGVTYEQPTRSNTSSVAAIQKQFLNPFAIVGINYEVQVSKQQFNSQFRYASGNTSGLNQIAPINVGGAQRNTQYNDKLLTLQFSRPLRLDQFGCLLLFVRGGETVNMTFFVGAFQS